MLTLLFALAAIWTLFWFVMLVLDWGNRTPFTDSSALCSTCANAITPNMMASKPAANGGIKQAVNTEPKSIVSAKTQVSEEPKAVRTATSTINAAAKPTSANSDTRATANVARTEDAQAAAKKSAQNNICKTPVADKHDQANVTPLFDAPNEKDDLKTIKGIGVVMEKTLNDLGITTFKQLAGFKQAEVKMVSNVLSESKAGFGDRIERDEWVDQAKGLVKKAS